MRALLVGAILMFAFALPVLGCNQDYAASNSDRQPFMEGRAAAPASSSSASAAAVPAAPTPH
jgi:hypothetical protein